jgi:hypothetical protein
VWSRGRLANRAGEVLAFVDCVRHCGVTVTSVSCLLVVPSAASLLHSSHTPSLPHSLPYSFTINSVHMMSPLLLLLVLLLQLTATSSSSSCSRLLSRRVRKFLQAEVFPRLPEGAREPSDLPLHCPLNPLHDIYHQQEEVRRTPSLTHSPTRSFFVFSPPSLHLSHNDEHTYSHIFHPHHSLTHSCMHTITQPVQSVVSLLDD